MSKKQFVPRLKKPEKGNPYYNTKSNGGYSTAIKGSPVDSDCNVLANCVGYAFGRANEIAENTKMTILEPRNAELFVSIAQKQGLKVGKEPKLGAVICWQAGPTLSNSDGAGHVAVVEQIISPDKIVTSESGWNARNPFWTQTRYKGTDGNWGQSSRYKFLGFIYNPALEDDNVEDQNPIEKFTNPYPVPTRGLQKGDTGEDVKWLQFALIKLGYLYMGPSDLDRDGELTVLDAQLLLQASADYKAEITNPYIMASVTGTFDLYTLGALLAYQLENGIDVIGVCGPKTRESLLKHMK